LRYSALSGKKGGKMERDLPERLHRLEAEGEGFEPPGLLTQLFSRQPQ
jgi:hypothetical protein